MLSICSYVYGHFKPAGGLRKNSRRRTSSRSEKVIPAMLALS